MSRDPGEGGQDPGSNRRVLVIRGGKSNDLFGDNRSDHLKEGAQKAGSVPASPNARLFTTPHRV